MPERSADWMRQAERDLEAAEKMFEDELFERACFAPQQLRLREPVPVLHPGGGGRCPRLWKKNRSVL